MALGGAPRRSGSQWRSRATPSPDAEGISSKSSGNDRDPKTAQLREEGVDMAPS